MAGFDMGLVQRGARHRRTPYYEAEQRHAPLGYTVYNHMLFPIRFDDVRGGVLAPAERRHGVGRGGRAVPRDLRARTASVHATAHASRPLQVRGRPGEVRACLRHRRRHHQRPRADADGREHVLAGAGVQRRAASTPRGSARLPAWTSRSARPTCTRLQVQGPRSKDVMRALFGEEILDLKYYYWSPRPTSAASRLSSRAPVGRRRWATRSTSCDGTEGTELWEAIMRAGEPYDLRPTGPVGHPPHRGRHLQLGRRHDLREQPLRDGARPAGRASTTRASRRRARRIAERQRRAADHRASRSTATASRRSTT